MTTDPGGTGAERVAPDEAFAALGNEARIQILYALWDADGSLTYSELKERIGIQNSGQFNYHLEKLLDQFVEKSDDGYDLRMAGEHVIGAVISGTLTHDPSFEPAELTGSCPHCGDQVKAEYANETLTVWCASEEGHIPVNDRPGVLAEVPFPPAGVADRAPDAVARAAMAWGNAQFTSMYDGVCPRCAGPVSLTIETCDDHTGGQGEICEECTAVFATWAHRECDICRFDAVVPAWVHLLQHPGVAGFFFDHDVVTIPWTWEVLTAATVRPTREEVSDDPFRVQFRFEVDGDHLDVRLDDALDVVETITAPDVT